MADSSGRKRPVLAPLTPFSSTAPLTPFSSTTQWLVSWSRPCFCPRRALQPRRMDCALALCAVTRRPAAVDSARRVANQADEFGNRRTRQRRWHACRLQEAGAPDAAFSTSSGLRLPSSAPGSLVKPAALAVLAGHVGRAQGVLCSAKRPSLSWRACTCVATFNPIRR